MRPVALMLLFCAFAWGAQSAPPAAPAIPLHTRFDGHLKTPLNSKTAKLGDPVTVEVTYPGKAGKEIVIPKHSLLQGTIVSVLPYQKKNRRGGLAVKFTELDTPSGAKIPLQAVIFQAYIDKFSSLGDAADTSVNHDMPNADIPGDYKLNMTSAEAVAGVHGLALYILGGNATAFMEQYGDVKISADQPLRLRLVTIASDAN